MRLLILHQAWVFGGAERTTANLLTSLDRDIVTRVTLAAPAALRRLMPPAFDLFLDTTGIIQGGWFESAEQLRRDVLAARRLLSEAQPDVALGMMHYSAALIAMSAPLLRSKRVRTVGGFRGPIYEYIRRYEHGLRRRLFLRLAIGAAARLADRIVVPSQGTADEVCRRFFGSSKRTVVIANGIDTNDVESAATAATQGLDRLPAHLPLLCVAARLSKEKDIDLLIDALRRIQVETPCALAIVGDGPERSILERQVKDCGLEERVAFIGHRDNVYPYMRRADIYVHTCQFEGFGYTMLEALACGTAVVATDCPSGPREVLDQGTYGVLVPPGDPDALGKAISRLLKDARRRERFGKLGLERASQLSLQRMTGRYQSLFQQLLHSARSRSTEAPR